MPAIGTSPLALAKMTTSMFPRAALLERLQHLAEAASVSATKSA